MPRSIEILVDSLPRGIEVVIDGPLRSLCDCIFLLGGLFDGLQGMSVYHLGVFSVLYSCCMP